MSRIRLRSLYIASIGNDITITTFDDKKTTLTGNNTTLTGNNTTPTNINTTHTGTEFVVMFTPYYNDTKFVQLIVTSNGENDININIESPFPGTFKTTYKSHHVAIVDLPRSIVDLSDGSNSNAVKITSNDPIFVVGLVGLGPYSTETFTAIPSNKLGQSYFIATHINTVRYYGKDKMQTIGIASLQDNTDVTIYFSNTSDIFLQSSNQTISAGTNYTFSLGYLDTFYFETMDDITGTRIESTSPIAVFDGLKQVGITYDYKSKKYDTNINELGMEQLPPTSTYSNEFIIPVLMHSAGMDAYIISPDPVYKIYTYTDDVYTVYQQENMHKATLSFKSATSIASQSPLLLNIHVKMRYLMKTSYFTVNIPAISQFSNQYVLATPFTNNTYENFLSVIIKADDVIGLRYDNHPVAPVSENLSIRILKEQSVFIDLSIPTEQSVFIDLSIPIEQSVFIDLSIPIEQPVFIDLSIPTEQSVFIDLSIPTEQSVFIDLSILKKAVRVHRSFDTNRAARVQRSFDTKKAVRVHRSFDTNRAARVQRSFDTKKAVRVHRSFDTNRAVCVHRSFDTNRAVCVHRSFDTNRAVCVHGSFDTNRAVCVHRYVDTNRAICVHRSFDINRAVCVHRSFDTRYQ
ncbi:unnamed protein product [Mytilus edulis]|uniref:IgGFc-binding protein N-terminal domain-containing protein n=1 Tax=Mytilus edulis TaxID=6550 RepID=A0A8S3SAK6_MYTED|nr:unnamed protein product [Mytilus edulis]